MEKVYNAARHLAFWGCFLYGFTLILAHMAHNLSQAFASL